MKFTLASLKETGMAKGTNIGPTLKTTAGLSGRWYKIKFTTSEAYLRRVAFNNH